ncbi:ficolin-2-like [Oculina patagonica]
MGIDDVRFECRVLCGAESTCVSINIGLHSSDGVSLCQLSNSDHIRHPDDLKPQEGFLYWATKNQCNSDPCLHNATCLNGFTDKRYICLCQAGYTGEHCETEIDECTTRGHKCDENGLCTSNGKTYKCICKDGFHGDGHTCMASCANNPCKNNAKCANTTDGYNCSCRDRFHGKICENAESCQALKLAGKNLDGLHQIHLTNIGSVQVFCDQQTDGGGWTIIQRRTSPFSLPFDRNWVEYENGFGNPQGEFWLGNKIIHELMNTARTPRIDLKMLKNKAGFGMFFQVTVDGPNDKYRMKIQGYLGNIPGCGSDSSWQSFTTKDSDNDKEPSKNCAVEDNAGWWYNDCGCGNLNRQTGPKWDSWHISNDTIVFSEIKIR